MTTPGDVTFEWSGGGHAELLQTDGDFVTVSSSRAAPPGTPLVGSFEGSSWRIKVRACRRTEGDAEHPYRIEGRFQNLTRAQRERLLLGAPT